MGGKDYRNNCKPVLAYWVAQHAYKDAAVISVTNFIASHLLYMKGRATKVCQIFDFVTINLFNAKEWIA